MRVQPRLRGRRVRDRVRVPRVLSTRRSTKGTARRTGTSGGGGNFSLTRFDANIGFGGTTAGCHCDYMWTGPMCDHPCPFPYNTSNGICVVKDESDEDYGAPWTAEIVCEDGFTGLPDFNYRLTSDQLSRGRDCEMTCQDCVHGTCQDDGTCLCDYGYIWARPARGGERRRIQRSGFTVSVDGGVFRRKRVRAAVPHVRGEAPVQSKRRARERDVRVARVRGSSTTSNLGRSWTREPAADSDVPETSSTASTARGCVYRS